MSAESSSALVLSAGLSVRMGDFKPLMMLAGKTVFERVIGLFQSAGIGSIHVVVGHRAAELTPLIDRLGGHSVFNERYPEGMFSSVAAGVRSLEARTESFFVLPVDIPLVRPSSLRTLLQAFPKEGGAICHPTFGGRRGHPPLIGRRFRTAIENWCGAGGLGALLEHFESDIIEVPVVDEFILQDMDEPQDYQRLCERFKTREVLSPSECHALLVERLNVSPAVWAHGRAVAEQARLLGQALETAGCRLNLDLITAAALVHDMARGKPGHAAHGGRILRELDMPLMAAIVETHMDFRVENEDPISEAEVVFLADKLICEDRFVGLDERFLPRLNDHQADPYIQASIRSKLESARTSAQRIESATGQSLMALRPATSRWFIK